MDSLRKAISSRERAAALIIVLAFVVLLTGLTLAYFSRTTGDRQVAQSSLHQSRADQVAASGMALVIGGLRQEITGPSPTPTPPYFPLPNANMLPLRFGNPAGVPDPIPNLVRLSVRGDVPTGATPIPSPGRPSFASAVNSTTDVSVNGRSIRLASWNSHYLLPKYNTGSDDYVPSSPLGSPFNPNPPVANGFTPPDWVILTRAPRNPTDPTSPYPVAFSTWDPALKDPTLTNNLYAVGRFAYAIYDEGGLLDVNVVGYPSPTPLPAQYGPKGVSAFADLTVAGIGILSAGVNGIVGWRNYFSASPSGTFPNFGFNTAGVNGYVSSVLSNTNGFMGVSIPIPAPTSRTDQQFPSRQSLIQLRAGIGSTNFPATALQYLTTFSRELNAPSWAPTLNATDMGALNNGAGNIYAYKDNAAIPAATPINPNLLNVHVINSFTRADGTTATVGDSLINRRFPLPRINGLADPTFAATTNSTIINGAPAPATAATVQRDFGLVWDGANYRWVYNSPNPTRYSPAGSLTVNVAGTGGGNFNPTNGTGSPANGVKTLAEVAAENREPDFFELLKAGILSGSVGLGSGTGIVRTFVNAEGKYYDTTNNLSSDYQVMQIGANIIDQWDSNNVPTFINFYDTTGNYEIAGIENLPYLNKLVFKPHWKAAGPQFEAWLLPSLWNPHQNAASATGNVRVAIASGTMKAFLTDSGTPSLITTTAPITGNPSTQFMTVAANSFATPSAPTAASIVKPPNPPSTITLSNDGYYGFYFPFLTTAGVTSSNSKTAYPDFGASPGCNFEMQVQVSTSPVVWKAYQRWTGCGPLNPLSFNPPASSWTLATLQDPEFVTLDPRTVRFGVWGNVGNQTTAATVYTPVLTTLDLSGGIYEIIPTAITALRPHGSSFVASLTSPNLYLYANNVVGTVYYTDLDGVQRLGDFLTTGATITTAMQPADSADRPLILSGAYPSPTPSAYVNGGFQSVAELGEVFRDQPWKTLNFTTASANTTSKSADAGLLDIFTLHESANEAGKTSLNARYKSFLTAILSNATKRLTGANVISTSERDNIVNALFTLTQAQPMVNKAELITRLAADASVTGLGNKEARELVLRAFSDACQTRTWNLLIDVIAQSGRYPPNASTLAGFLVEGEQHYWVHVAIDRFTGQVVDKQIEVVNE